jgi:hypothetical protein
VTKLLINTAVAFAFGVQTARYQIRNGAVAPFWFTLIYAALFVVGLGLLETWCGIF